MSENIRKQLASIFKTTKRIKVKFALKNKSTKGESIFGWNKSNMSLLLAAKGASKHSKIGLKMFKAGF